MRKTLFFLLDSAGVEIYNKLVPVELKPEYIVNRITNMRSYCVSDSSGTTQ